MARVKRTPRSGKQQKAVLREVSQDGWVLIPLLPEQMIILSMVGLDSGAGLGGLADSG